MAAGDPLQSLLHGDPLKASDVDLAALAGKVGHAFTRVELAVEALTHRGTLDRRPDLKAAFPQGNERLEFLGDRVLSLAMADLLLRRFPQEREGQLARRHAALVSAKTLVEIARAIGLRDHLIGYRGAPPATPAILSDMLEALLGAIFLDADFEAAARTVEHLWDDRLGSNNPAPRPPKTQLQEWAQGRGLALPAYRQVGREGSEHEPVFLVEVKVGTLPAAQGRGQTKRDAESAAASLMLEQLSKA
ncbi:MAG: ribonuclease [Rhodospirillaceae bacterium]|jgi:ribonuclease-3|nr:ribonuclease [Rhodospirillaceae bacterium]MEA2808263.1 ribonuclease [Rhodospirillaceae bacterium]